MTLQERLDADLRGQLRRGRPLPAVMPQSMGEPLTPRWMPTKPLVARPRPVQRDETPPYRAAHPKYPRQMSQEACRRVVRGLINAVVTVTGHSRAVVLGPSKRRDLARPRQTAMYLCRWHTGMSLPEVASAFGRGDHTSCLQALRSVSTRRVYTEQARESKLMARLARLAGLSRCQTDTFN